MHGLINTAIEAFARETYGQDLWLRVSDEAGLGFTSFEAMLSYEDGVTDRTITALACLLGRARDPLLEDLGTFLVTSPTLPAIRRLLRFGGVTYEDFLHSLEDLPDRVRLAVDDLSLPGLNLIEHGQGRFVLHCDPGLDGYGHVMVGVLRAIADDYGALAMLDHQGARAGDSTGGEAISIAIIEDTYAEGRSFELGMGSS